MSIRKERAKRLIEVSDGLAADFAASQTGREAEILVEKIEEKEGRLVAEGYTANYIRTFADIGDRELTKGSIIHGTIIGSDNETCLMKPV